MTSLLLMSFAQSLGRKAKGVQEQFSEEIFRGFMKACEAEAAKGCCFCEKKYQSPEWWSDGDLETLKQRVGELGFCEFVVRDVEEKKNRSWSIECYAQWDLESQAPEKTGTGPSGTSSTCPICHETRPAVALMPCGHVVCQRCQESQRFRQCPMCRKQVTGATQGLFM